MSKTTYLAAALLVSVTTVMPAQHVDTRQGDAPDAILKAAVTRELVDGDIAGAIRQYRDIATRYRGTHRGVAARALLQMARSYEKLASPNSRAVYEEVLRDFADQSAAAAEASAMVAALQSGGTRNSGIVQQQVWASEFVEGTPSPDGRYIPWVNWPDGGNLAVHDLATGEDRILTHARDQSFAVEPSFFPDSKRLIFGWYDRPSDTYELRAIEADGSNPRTLLRAQPGGGGPVSPDGKLIASVLRNDVLQLGLLNISSGRSVILKSVEWREPELGNFSPDGRFLAYSLRDRQDSEDRSIHLIAVDGSSESTVISPPGANRRPFFTPDGRRVVFTSNRSGRWDLWSSAIADGKPAGAPELLRSDIGSVRAMGFSRDGTFFYSQSVDQRDAYDVEIDPLTARATSTPQRVSERFINSSVAPTWSPDGVSLLYAAQRGQTSLHEGGEIKIMIREAGREREVTTSLTQFYFASSLRWFPDKRSALVAEWLPRAGRRVYRRIDAVAGQTQTLFEAPFLNILATVIATDGRSVVYPRRDEKDNRIVHLIRRNLDTAAEGNILSSTRTNFHGLSASADGRQVAFMSRVQQPDSSTRWALCVAAIPGGEVREIWTSHDKFLFPYQTAWDPRGRGVFLTVSSRDYFTKPQEIWYVPLDGGEPHSTGISMPEAVISSVHPNGDRIAFTGGMSTTKVWTLKNLFAESHAAK